MTFQGLSALDGHITGVVGMLWGFVDGYGLTWLYITMRMSPVTNDTHENLLGLATPALDTTQDAPADSGVMVSQTLESTAAAEKLGYMPVRDVKPQEVLALESFTSKYLKHSLIG